MDVHENALETLTGILMFLYVSDWDRTAAISPALHASIINGAKG